MIPADAVLQLRALLLSIDSTERGYAARFTLANLPLETDEFVAKWAMEQVGRAEAAARELHRQEILVNDLKSLPKDRIPEIIAMLTGVEAESQLGENTTE